LFEEVPWRLVLLVPPLAPAGRVGRQQVVLDGSSKISASKVNVMLMLRSLSGTRRSRRPRSDVST
jgi:hypothetical protein